MRSCFVLCLSVLFGKSDGSAAAPPPLPAARLQLSDTSLEVDPNSREALRRLAVQIDLLLRERGVELSKKETRGLKAMRLRAEELVAAPSLPEIKQRELIELALAVGNNQRFPVPRDLEFFAVPVALFDHWYNPVAIGRVPAGNLGPASDAGDPSLCDPSGSSFWRAPARIETQDLYHGFGRSDGPPIEGVLWHYAGPKTGFGVNPGLELEAPGLRAKIKFGETHSEPFAARIFTALGFNADPTDYVPSVEFAYDRRFFLEFNSRRPLETRFSFLWIVPLYHLKLQRREDPFDYVAGAKLRDGTYLGRAELKARLLSQPVSSSLLPEHFRPDFEARILSLVTVPANFQLKDESVLSIGPWDFGQLDHAARRELRGAGLLAAWMGWCDSRFDNTRLRISRDGTQLRHYFSDLGGGLGRNGGTFFWQGELPNDFPWAFTRSGYVSNRLGARDWFRIVEFKPIDDTAAFAEMTVQDARWMARRIAQLSEAQIVQALIGAGFDSAQVRLYTEKLITRRDHMLLDLKLADEIPPLRPDGPDQQIDYDPAREGPVRVGLLDGRVVSAPIGSHLLRQGRLEELGPAPPQDGKLAGAPASSKFRVSSDTPSL